MNVNINLTTVQYANKINIELIHHYVNVNQVILNNNKFNNVKNVLHNVKLVFFLLINVLLVLPI